MTVTIAKWTVEQYHQMIAAGVLENRSVELLNGEILERPPEGEPHAYYSHEAAKYLEQKLGDRATVRQSKPITIKASESEPEPDLAIVQPLGRVYLNHHPYPENIFWVIEFSQSSLSKDLGIKANTYAQAEIEEYWLINLRTLEVVIFRNPSEGKYQSQTRQTQGTVTPLAFPDIQLSVNDLLA